MVIDEIQLDEMLDHIAECWGHRLQEDVDAHPKLKTVWVDLQTRRELAEDLLEVLSIDCIHSLPTDLIRLVHVAKQVGVAPEFTIRAAMISPLFDDAKKLIDEIVDDSVKPSNIIPLNARLH